MLLELELPRLLADYTGVKAYTDSIGRESGLSPPGVLGGGLSPFVPPGPPRGGVWTVPYAFAHLITVSEPSPPVVKSERAWLRITSHQVGLDHEPESPVAEGRRYHAG